MSEKGGRSDTTVRLVSEQLGSAPEHLRSRQRVGAPGSDRRLQRLIVDMGAVGDHRAVVANERGEIDAERKIDQHDAGAGDFRGINRADDHHGSGCRPSDLG